MKKAKEVNGNEYLRMDYDLVSSFWTVNSFGRLNIPQVKKRPFLAHAPLKANQKRMNSIGDKKSWFDCITKRQYTTIRTGLRLYGGASNAVGETGLMNAARTNDCELAKILCIQEAGIKNKDGHTALILAACYDHHEICDVIAPFEKKYATNEGKNALMFAAENGCTDSVKVLCGYFDLKERDNDGLSALDYAMNNTHPACVEAIMEAGKITEEAANKQIAQSIRNSFSSLEEFYKLATDYAELPDTRCKCCDLPYNLCSNKDNVVNIVRKYPPFYAQNPTSASATVTTKVGQAHGISPLDPNQEELLNQLGPVLKEAQLRAWYSDICEEIVRLREDHAKITIENRELTDNLGTETATHDALKLKFDKLKLDYDETSLKYEDLVSRHNAVMHECEMLKADAEKAREQRVAVEVLHQKISNMLSSTGDDISKTIEDMLKTHHDEMQKRTEELELMKHSVDVMAAEHAVVKKEMDKLTESKVQAEAQVSIIQNRLMAKEEENRHMTNRLEVTTAMINELEAKNNELEIETSKLMDEVTKSRLMTQQLIGKVNEKEKLLEDTRDELAHTLGEREALYHRINLITDDKEAAEARIQRKEESISLLHDDKRNLEGQVLFLTEELTKSQIAAKNMSSKMRLENPLGGSGGSNGPRQLYPVDINKGAGSPNTNSNAVDAFINNMNNISTGPGSIGTPQRKESHINAIIRNMMNPSNQDLQQAIIDSDKPEIANNITNAMISANALANFDMSERTGSVNNSAARSSSSPSRFLNLHLMSGSMRIKSSLHNRDNNIAVTGQDKRNNRLTELMEAARDNDFVKAYHRIDIQGGLQDDHGYTALMYAASEGNLEMCRLLVEKEAGMCSHDGTTALMRAVSGGYADVAAFLLDKEAGMQRNDGWTALMAAACDNRPDIVTILAYNESGIVTNENFSAGAGVSALMLAATGGHQECVQLLLPYEATLQHSSGRTAADYASSEDLRDIILEYAI